MAQNDYRKLLILALVGLLFCVAFAFVLNRTPVSRSRADIYLRWYATRKLLSEGRSLYDARNALEVSTSVWGSARPGYFYYPAYLTVFVAPLALLSYPAAHLVWTVAVQLFYLVGLWLSTRLTSWPSTVNKLTVFLVASALFIPTLQHTIWGQFNTIGLLSLVLCYGALRSGRYGLAGVFAAGLTFKPHVTVLALVFLLIWALVKRERWRFCIGFGLAVLALWTVGEHFEPGWLFDFLTTLSGYDPAQSVLDSVFNPYQVVAALLCLASVAILLLKAKVPAASPAFAGCLSLSLAVWFLVVPVIGMMHAVVLPFVAVLVLSSYRASYPALYRYALYGTITIYVLGMVGFIWGLTSPGQYGTHTFFSELAYRTLAPVYMGLLSLPLCFRAEASLAEAVA